MCIVLDTNDEKALLLTKDCIDWSLFYGGNSIFEPAKPSTWSNSHLRKIINEKKNQMFSEQECDAIISELFILSADQLNEYLPIDIRPANIIYCDKSVDDKVKVYEEPIMYWLNTVGAEENKMSIVDETGEINYEGLETDADEVGVRVAMWIDRYKYTKLKNTRK